MVLKLAKDRDFEKAVESTIKQLETIDRDLFLPTDPDLATFHQGRLGDCYLLSTLAANAHRRPQVIRSMIHPEVTGGFQVEFGNGQRIKVATLTDCELLVGAQDGQQARQLVGSAGKGLRHYPRPRPRKSQESR